jgi:hypothetical protein
MAYSPFNTERILRGRANAHLIAAAPELLEALERIICTLDVHEIECLSCNRDGESYCGCLNKPIEAARAAIAKAKGE